MKNILLKINKRGGFTHTPKFGVTPKGGGFTHTPKFGVTPKGGGFTHTPKFGVTPKGGGFTHTPKFGVTPKGGGFTLLETLIAVAIFATSILALLSVLSQSISSTSFAKRKMIASYLAQEGIEYVRNIRDGKVLYIDQNNSQNGWNNFLSVLQSNSCDTTGGCVVNPDNSTVLEPLSSSQCIAGMLLYDSSNGKYRCQPTPTTSSSGYIRKITVKQVNVGNTEEEQVSSTVSWVGGTGTNSVVFSENLFNWVE